MNDTMTEPTLRDEVIALLSPAQAHRFEAAFPALDEPPYQAIRRMNAFWRDELALSSRNTVAIRASLVDDSSRVSWLRVFKRDVLPTVVALDLPR